MATIVIGTTPTIIYKFSIVDPQNFIAAEMTIKNKNSILLRKELSDATIGGNTIQWDLTQEETLGLGTGSMTMMLNWLTAGGKRGTSKEINVQVMHNHIEEVMT